MLDGNKEEEDSIMKTFLLGALILSLAGCGSMLAERDAERACQHLQGTSYYGACYADAYSSARAGYRTAGAAMMGTGARLMTRPSYQAPARPTTTNCHLNPYTNQMTCTTF